MAAQRMRKSASVVVTIFSISELACASRIGMVSIRTAGFGTRAMAWRGSRRLEGHMSKNITFSTLGDSDVDDIDISNWLRVCTEFLWSRLRTPSFDVTRDPLRVR